MASSRTARRKNARRARTLAQQKRARRDEWLSTRDEPVRAFGTGVPMTQLRQEVAEFREVIARGGQTPGHYEAFNEVQR